MAQQSLRDPDRPPVHPAEIIREDVFPTLGLTRSDFASALGISRQMLHALFAERHPITVEMAVKLGHVLGNGPGVWLRMQQAYDLWHAERSVDKSKLRVLAEKTVPTSPAAA